MSASAEVKQFADDRPLVFGAHTSSPPRLYANAFQISVEDGEVILRVGDIVEHRHEARVAQENVTLILSHYSFVKLSDAMGKAAELLRSAYGGEVPQLHLSADMLESLRAQFDESE